MHNSAADIAAFSTGRETILIGPRSAFGLLNGQTGVLRNRADIHAALQTFLMRQNTEELVRPWLRRWGLEPGPLYAAHGHTLIEMLARAAESGRIGVMVVPEPTMAFAGIAERQEAAVRTLASQRKSPGGSAAPASFEERVLLVLTLAPNHMAGETRMAFEELVKSIGIGMLASGLVVWIGAHFVPGLNLAVLAFDLFALSGEVIKAMEAVAKAFEDIRKAKTAAELDIVAKALAAALAVLIANGVLARFLKAKSVTKAVGKRAGPVKKPAPPKQEPRKPQRKQQGEKPGEPDSNSGRSRTETFDSIKKIPKGQRPSPESYMSPEEIAEHGKRFENGASRLTLKNNLKKYGPGQKDGTTFVMPKDEMDKLIKSAGGDKAKLESALGLPKGTLDNDELVRIDITDPKALKVRMPSGNEAGANDLWLPGGKLPTGNHEAVVDIGSAPPGAFSTTSIGFE